MESTALNSVSKIDDDLYVITETKSIHCYLLIGKEKALLIDAGYGYEDIHPLIRQITELPVMLAVTHGDPDHALGAMHFEDVWIHPLDYGKLLMNDTPKIKGTMLEHRYHKMPETKELIDKEAYLSTSIGRAKPHWGSAGFGWEICGNFSYAGAQLWACHVLGAGKGQAVFRRPADW